MLEKKNQKTAKQINTDTPTQRRSIRKSRPARELPENRRRIQPAKKIQKNEKETGRKIRPMEREKLNQERSSRSSENPRIRKRPPSEDMPRTFQKPPKKTKNWKKYFLLVAGIFCVILVVGYLYLRFSPLNSSLSIGYSRFNISRNAAKMGRSERIVNVAVFGVDGREDVEGERSDSIMIASADYEHGKLKVTSLMRDTYTYNEELNSFDKLNAAYSLGGPKLALKVINENFDTPITDYVTIDFTALVEMVNAVGGVEINVTDEEELYWINQYLADVNDKVHTQDAALTSTGLQTLTGSQALAYSRIRYTGNGDYDRTQRQRNILEQVLAKASSQSPFKLISLVRKMLPYIDTSMSVFEIGKNLVNIMVMTNHQLEQYRLPADGMVVDGYLDGVSYVFPDTLIDNIKAWYQFVYEAAYTPSARAEEISEEIAYTGYY